jgi:hypothetical protein
MKQVRRHRVVAVVVVVAAEWMVAPHTGVALELEQEQPHRETVGTLVVVVLRTEIAADTAAVVVEPHTETAAAAAVVVVGPHMGRTPERELAAGHTVPQQELLLLSLFLLLE